MTSALDVPSYAPGIESTSKDTKRRLKPSASDAGAVLADSEVVVVLSSEDEAVKGSPANSGCLSSCEVFR